MTHALPNTTDSLSALYEQDYHLWLKATANLLKEGQLSALDRANLSEKIEDIGRSEKRAVYSNLKIVLLHLLKYRYQPEQRSKSWTASIVEHRQRLKRSFRDSPSLQPYALEILNEYHQDARALAAAETSRNDNRNLSH